jgi:hypothetical protein
MATPKVLGLPRVPEQTLKPGRGARADLLPNLGGGKVGGGQ